MQGLIVALLALGLQAIVVYRQQHKRLLSMTSAPPRGLVFPEADPKNWDTNLIDMIKFFFNYGFYKFGLEVFVLFQQILILLHINLCSICAFFSSVNLFSCNHLLRDPAPNSMKCGVGNLQPVLCFPKQ